jgi:hypothetical protein
MLLTTTTMGTGLALKPVLFAGLHVYGVLMLLLSPSKCTQWRWISTTVLAQLAGFRALGRLSSKATAMQALLITMDANRICIPVARS